jgi:hypothetical protein
MGQRLSETRAKAQIDRTTLILLYSPNPLFPEP